LLDDRGDSAINASGAASINRSANEMLDLFGPTPDISPTASLGRPSIDRCPPQTHDETARLSPCECIAPLLNAFVSGHRNLTDYKRHGARESATVARSNARRKSAVSVSRAASEAAAV
jgi:hypothetical protein